jgi:hypothetical protein
MERVQAWEAPVYVTKHAHYKIATFATPNILKFRLIMETAHTESPRLHEEACTAKDL